MYIIIMCNKPIFIIEIKLEIILINSHNSKGGMHFVLMFQSIKILEFLAKLKYIKNVTSIIINYNAYESSKQIRKFAGK